MALYKTHTLFNILALPLIVLGTIYFFNPTLLQLIIFAGAFVYATLFMNPDLDLANKIRLVSLRGLLSLPFRLYAKVFRHRGLSHSPIFGTATRVLWLGGIYFLIMLLLGKTLPDQKSMLSILKNSNFLFGLSGVIIADFCHLLLDLKSS